MAFRRDLLLRCGEGLNPIDTLLESSFGIPEIDGTLSIKPKLRRVAKKPRKPKRHLWRNRASLSKQFVDGLARNT